MWSKYIATFGTPYEIHVHAALVGTRKVIVINGESWEIHMNARSARELIAHVQDGLARIEAMIEYQPLNIDDKEPS